MAAEIHIYDRGTDARVHDQLECIFDGGGSDDTRACFVECIVKIERDERLIFHDEHGEPQKGIDASHNTTPAPLTRMSVGEE